MLGIPYVRSFLALLGRGDIGVEKVVFVMLLELLDDFLCASNINHAVLDTVLIDLINSLCTE
jgi:hypothetical protein